MKFKTDEFLSEVYWGEVEEREEGEAPSPYKIIEEEEWVSEGKYDYSSVIFEFEGRTYNLDRSRSGSYHSEYYYDREDWGDEVDCREVEKVEVVKHEWRKKK